MASAENWLPVTLLLEYFALLLLMHYAWLRENQSTNDSSAGWMLMCLGLCFLFWGFGLAESHRFHPTFLRWVLAALLPGIVVLLIAGFRLHRSMEVRS